MTTFAEFVARGDNVGTNFIVDVRLVRGVTTVYRRYTQVFTPNVGPQPPAAEARIVKLGNLTKAFGPTNGLTATTLSVTLDNTDGECDWLSDRLTYASDAIKAEFVVALEVYDVANPVDNALKTLGLFVLRDPPRRTETVVELSLVDDALGAASQIAETPSVVDWIGITDANRPSWLVSTAINGSFRGSNPDFDWTAPLPLQFGREVPCQWVGRNCYVICAVAGSAGALPTGVAGITVFDQGIGLPATRARRLGATTQTVWTVRRTPDITKNGKTFHLLWVDVDLTDTSGGYPVSGLPDWFLSKTQNEATTYGTQSAFDLFNYWEIHRLVQPVRAQGYLFSHLTDDVNPLVGVHPTQVAVDLVESYAVATVPIDAASFTAARTARPGALAAGELSAFESPSVLSVYGGQMNKALAGLGAAGLFDVFFAWDGTLTAAAHVADFDTLTATIPTLATEDVVGEISERIPGTGERNAPFNRLVAKTPNGQISIDASAEVASWEQVKAKTIDASWMGQRPGRLIFYGLVDPTVRPVLTVRTHLNGLLYDLGDYLRFTWPREDVGDVYTAAVFRVEAIRLDPESCTVQFDLVWVDDFFDGSVTPYVLDDETTSTRATGSGGRTVTLTTASTTVTFSSGNLVSDGVSVGDQLIVLDATEAADGFDRNRVLTITGSITATTCVVDASDFGSGGPFALSTWEIRRSQLTYRSNATIYGKTSDANSQFGSPLVSANRLLDG